MFLETVIDPMLEWVRTVPVVNKSFCFGVMATAVLFGGLTQIDCVGNHEGNNGNHGNAAWLSLTIVTTGLIFLSYYLGGIFNSKLISEEEYGGHAVLRFQSRVKLLPISELIRKQARKAERERVKSYERRISAMAAVKDHVKTQSDFLVEAILEGYIYPWYHQISEERLFPMEVQLILHEAFGKLRTKIENVDRTLLAVETVEILHAHWNEYCTAVKKIKSPNELLIQKFTLCHPYVENREEVRKQYESILSSFLPELLPTELQSPLLSKFLAGIIVKGVLLYYVDLLTDPKWLNTFLVSLISSGNFVTVSDTGSNPSGSNISSSPPSPSSTSGTFTPLNKVESAASPCGNGDETDKRLEHVGARASPISNFLDSKVNGGRERSKVNDPGERSEVNDLQERSIENALGGVLSTTALPLLPDGVSYANPTQEPPEEKKFSIQFSNIPTPKPHYPTSPSTAQRHKSWEEAPHRPTKEDGGADDQLTATGGAKSFDECRATSFVERQNEFDFGQPSPAYEEAEDFAATIAKLRSLLEQRQSQTNIVEGLSGKEEPGSVQGEANSKVGGVKIGAKTRRHLDSQSSGSSLGSDGSSSSAPAQDAVDSKLEKIEDDEDAVEDDCESIISRFFQDVSIPKTESCGDSADQFTLFCIQYTGVYVENESGDYGSPKLVLRTTTVKRSLNEFLLLQTQLEKNVDFRGHLRGIKSHNTWLSLPFTHRRILLQRYLQQLSAHPVLGFCPELCQFMAYGDDGFQMFAPFPNRSTHLPRFDRLTKTFTGVLNSLKDALPSFADDEHEVRSLDGDGGNRPAKPRKRLKSFFQFGPDKKRSNEAVEEVEVSRTSEGSESDATTSDSEDAKKSSDSESETEKNLTLGSIPAPVQTEIVSPRPETSLDGMYPLASAVTKFLCDVLWLPEQRPKNASVSAVMSVSGKSLERYLSESLDILLSEDAFVGYMEIMTGALRDWSTPTAANQEPPALTVDDLKLCLKQRLPTWVRWVWGRNRLELTIERLAEFFQIPALNHDFLLSVSELIFSKLRTKKL